MMHQPPPDQLSPIQQTILTCISDNPARFSRSALAKLLVGSTSTRTAGLAEHPDSGRLAGRGRKEITFEVDILLQQGYLALDQYDKLLPAGGSSNSRDR